MAAGELTDPTKLGRVLKPVKSDIFIGSSAKNWNPEAAERAVKMETSGASPESIWKETGTFRGPDGKLRQEISEEQAEYRPGRAFLEQVEEAKNKKQKVPKLSEMITTVESVLDYPDLYEAYPDLASSTYYVAKQSELGPNIIGIANDKGIGLLDEIAYNLEKGKSVSLHELQHKIQQKENFGLGGSPEISKDYLLENYYDELNKLSPFLGKIKKAEKLKYEARKKLKELKEKSNDKNLTQESISESKLKNIISSANRVLRKNKSVVDAKNKIEESYQHLRRLSDYETYRRLLGEAESRSVQDRMNMSSSERRLNFPKYDVPTEEIIVKTLRR